MVILSLGSNLGEREKQLEKAISHLKTSGFEVHAVSPVMETEAWGKEDQPDFLNLAVAGEWNDTPEALMDILLDIEQNMGRIRKEKWGPRIIDIDIIDFEGMILSSEKLSLPHPRLAEREFVLAPIAAIAPDAKPAGFDQSYSQLLEQLIKK